MKLPSPRFTLRSLIILVALSGVALAVGIECERRRARFKARLKLEIVQYLKMTRGCSLKASEDRDKFSAEFKLRKTQYLERMIEKYDWAYRYPWFPVAPDPPAPK